MRYTMRIAASELRKKYDAIIGWGAGSKSFTKKYNPFMYKLDAMIDTSKEKWGLILSGMCIEPPDALCRFGGDICLVIFPNIEDDVIACAKNYLKDFDTIMAALIDPESNFFHHHYGMMNQDLIFAQMFEHLGISNPSYLDVGVCHPVLHNNTYLFYEQGKYNGVLVEPNPDMCELARIYRPNNRVIEAGVGSMEGNLKYYMHPDHSKRGLNTFSAQFAASRGMEDNYCIVPILPLDKIIEENFDAPPNLLDLEVQGLEYDAISAMDTETYKIDVIRTIIRNDKNLFIEMIEKKGYVLFMETYLGDIYLRRELLH